VTELAKLAPGLHSGPYNFFSLDEQSFDPRDLARALPKAVKAAGVALYEQTAVVASAQQARAGELETTAGPVIAQHFDECKPRVERTADSLVARDPEGQMLAVELFRFAPIRARCPHAEALYRPRGQGDTVIGATVENAAFDKSVQPEAIPTAAEAAPCGRRSTGQIVETWAGLRLATADHPADDRQQWPKLLAAMGISATGYPAGSGDGAYFAELITGSEPSINLTPFRAFCSPSVHSHGLTGSQRLFRYVIKEG